MLKRSLLIGRGFPLIFVILLIFPSCGKTPKKTKDTRLNLVLITIDTLRADYLGSYGGKIPTPNIDRLAAKSTVFRRAFAHTSTTLPSHTNMLLGKLPPNHGIHDNTHFLVPSEHTTLAELLKDNGYSTAAFIGGFPLDSGFGLDQGFDLYDDDFGPPTIQGKRAEERPADAVVGGALDWIKDRSDPWFLWIHCYDPHDPYTPPEPYHSQYSDNLYGGEVAYVDAALGRLFDYLESESKLANTLVILTGDHGESLGEHGEETHGFFAYNSTIWIPLLISSPSVSVSDVDGICGHVDLYPTVCELLNLDRPEGLQGISLASALRGKKLPGRPLYFESLMAHFAMGWAPIHGFISDWKKFIDSPIPELYELKQDFNEQNNLAEKEGTAHHRKRTENMIESLISSIGGKAKAQLDKRTLERLQSLGYLSGTVETDKTTFDASDDVKTLMPQYARTEKALDMVEEGRIREGTEILKEVITSELPIPSAYIYLARIYNKQNSTPDAVEVMRLARERLPANYQIFSEYTLYLFESFRFDELIQEVEAANFLRMDFDPYIWHFAGTACMNTGRLQQARECFERSLQIDSNYSVTYTNLGLVLLQSENTPDTLDEAESRLNQASELDPLDFRAINGLGLVSLRRGLLDKAIEYFEKALELNPAHDDSIFSLAVAYRKKGSRVQAEAFLKRFQNSSSYKRMMEADRQRLMKIYRSQIIG